MGDTKGSSKANSNRSSKTITRRKVLAAGAATGVVGLAGANLAASNEGRETSLSSSAKTSSKTSGKPSKGNRMPVVYLPHGGGPWPFVDLGFVPRHEADDMSAYLRGLPSFPQEKPKALLVISAHWEERVPTLMTSPNPPMYYDYYGFPPESYEVTWPAPGDPALASRVRSLLEGAGFPVGENPTRGFDHGTFVPLKVAFPEADIPTVQLSLQAGLDPATHLAMGRALAPLRDEGVFIVGSGMSYHNMREFMSPRGGPVSEAFDNWLREASTADAAERDRLLSSWTEAPMARAAHPREEHLLPLMVCAGAAGDDRGTVAWSGTFAGKRISAVHYG